MPLTRELRATVTFVLAGGQGERLLPMTNERAKPAVPFGGAYRIIDFTLSNCIHSGLRRIYVLTQYLARSLEEHIRFAWSFLPRRLEQFLTTRPPQHRGPGSWYQGTADAIYQNLDAIDETRPRHVVILAGDHVYKMDYQGMIREHLENRAAVTIGAVRIPAAESPRFGVFQCDEKGRILAFQEKPAHGREIPGQPGSCLGSMGIYVFETDVLVERLREDAARGGESSHDFGRDILPRMIGQAPLFAHHFVDRRGNPEPYWRDVGTIDAYFEANLDLCRVEPQFDLYDPEWPIYSFAPPDPPAKTVFDAPDRRAEVTDSLLCPGVVVSGARVRRSVLSNRVRVEEHATVEESILFHGVVVGRGARVRRAIVDKWVRIPGDATVGHDLAADRRRFPVTPSGIVVVPKGYVFPARENTATAEAQGEAAEEPG